MAERRRRQLCGEPPSFGRGNDRAQTTTGGDAGAGDGAPERRDRPDAPDSTAAANAIKKYQDEALLKIDQIGLLAREAQFTKAEQELKSKLEQLVLTGVDGGDTTELEKEYLKRRTAYDTASVEFMKESVALKDRTNEYIRENIERMMDGAAAEATNDPAQVSARSSLAETYWKRGDNSNFAGGEFQSFRFEPSGEIEVFVFPDGRRKGKWQQDGTAVTVQIDTDVYRGRIDGKRITIDLGQGQTIFRLQESPR